MDNTVFTDTTRLKNIIEGALLAAGQSLTLQRIEELFEEGERPERDEIVAALAELEADCRDRGYELRQTASGYRFQVRQELAHWVARLWEEKPKKYTRALLETLALIAYRQPITRGDIEQVRGVAVSSDLIRTLMEREWVRVVGHRDVPGRPALYATTRQFLDYFNLKSLDELPPLGELRDLDEFNAALDFGMDGSGEEEGAEKAVGGEGSLKEGSLEEGSLKEGFLKEGSLEEGSFGKDSGEESSSAPGPSVPGSPDAASPHEPDVPDGQSAPQESHAAATLPASGPTASNIITLPLTRRPDNDHE